MTILGINTNETRRYVDYTLSSLTANLSYALGQGYFSLTGGKGSSRLNEVGVVKLGEKTGSIDIKLPANYQNLVDTLAGSVAERLKETRYCSFRSSDEIIETKLKNSKDLPPLIADIPEFKEKKIGHLRINETADLPGLKELANALIPQVEEQVYGSPVYVEVATVYRNLDSVLPEHASVLWHSDNHFEGILKIMIYLTDVTETTAPFEYLRKKDTHELVHVKPAFKRKYPGGRVPEEVIAKYKTEGYEAYKATGKKGTAMLFDDKIIHKGNYAKEGYRDVLVLQLKPSVFKRPYIDKAYTRSV